MKLRSLFFNNIGLKLLALMLAFITLFYVSEATKTDSQATMLQKVFSRSSYILKELYVKPVFVGNPPDGYEFLEGNVKVAPASVLVIGPARFLSDKEFMFTKPINLGKHTKARMLDVELENVSSSVKSQKTKIQIYLPIEKVK